MNLENIIKKVTIKEKFDEEKNDSSSFDLDLEEKYNKLYSNFEVKERKNNFWESMNKKRNNKILALDNLNNVYHFLNYKNYQIMNNTDLAFQNNINSENNNNNSPQIKKGRNKNIFNYFKKNNSENSLTKNNKLSYEFTLDKTNVYNRLYNQGFFIQNKICINRIKNEESFSKSLPSYKNFKNQSQKLLLYKSNFNKNKQHPNKSANYYKDDETFKPNINKNSIRIVERIQKNKIKKNDKQQKVLELSFNNDKNNINKMKYDIFKNNYKNLYNYINKRKYSYFNENLNKSQSQRILSLHKKNIENYRNKNNNETEKNNNENIIVKNNEKFKAYNIYEKNKKWEKLRNEKIKNLKEIRQNIELFESMKELDLPGKQNYEKYKNLIIKVFSPKEKPNSYASLKRKNYTNKNSITSFHNENIDVNFNKDFLNYYNKNNRTNKYHRQKLKYINNEGKEIFLQDQDYKDDKSNNNKLKTNNKNIDEFTKLVKENKENIMINDINKKKNTNYYNKIKQNKNSLEYKIKNINKVFKLSKKK